MSNSSSVPGSGLNLDAATLTSIVASAVQHTLQQLQQSPTSAPTPGPSTVSGCNVVASNSIVLAPAKLSERLTSGR